MAKKTQPSVTQNVTGDNNIVIAGNENTVNQTIIQKFFNIFKSDAETTDQRNHRIMLGHVENFWVKGILEKSLYGATLLELGIKEDPDALTYPWEIKREATKETLSAGMSMLQIFQEIGMGRSLLILGAPGSGKTTMLLELTRQLIERAREDVTEPIPVVFNLSSWTRELTLAGWLARELNVIYTIPKKNAPTWVQENKMLLLLDGLDEVRQESREKCVEAINQFRKENGLTSIVVCSRIQDYGELKTRLSFDGAIEIQPLTSIQVGEYFKRFGKLLAGIRQVLENDAVLREIAETPLFLSIMTLAYRDTQSKDILVSEKVEVQRKHLFDIYIERMFKRPERSKNEKFKKQDVLRWLSWLARKMVAHNEVPYLFEHMQPEWLNQKNQVLWYGRTIRIVVGLIYALMGGLIGSLIGRPIVELIFKLVGGQLFRLGEGQSGMVIVGLIGGLMIGRKVKLTNIRTVDSLVWNWKVAGKGLINGMVIGLRSGLKAGLIIGLIFGLTRGPIIGLSIVVIFGLIGALIFGMIHGTGDGLKAQALDQTLHPGQRLYFSISNFLLTFLVNGLIFGLIYWLIFWLIYGLIFGLIYGLSSGLVFGLSGWLIYGLIGGMFYGGNAVIQHYVLRLILSVNNLVPWKLVPLLNHCVDLIFLRRVGGGYIFVHRLLMEHFADMYTADEK